MHKEISLTKNLRIGIDTDAYGLAIGVLKDPLIKVKGIMILIFYIAWKTNRLNGKKVETFTLLDTSSTKVGNKFYRVVPHLSYQQKVLYVRERGSGNIIEHTHGAIISDKGFEGALIYKPNSHRPDFYSPDEFYFFNKGDKVEGYIDGDEIKVLSIVD